MQGDDSACACGVNSAEGFRGGRENLRADWDDFSDRVHQDAGHVGAGFAGIFWRDRQRGQLGGGLKDDTPLRRQRAGYESEPRV